MISVIRAGNKDGLKALLEDRADPSIKDEVMTSPLVASTP